jgi:TRAP-type uncharacterized transport system substrate-binding protein
MISPGPGHFCRAREPYGPRAAAAVSRSESSTTSPWRRLPDDLVYHVVRAVFENHEEMMEAHAAAAATVPGNINRNSFLPLHPGAIHYYRQIGRAGQTD